MSVTQILDIRSRYRGPAFRAIVDILREDPVLSRVVKVWRTQDGSPGEFMPPANGQLPMIAISPIPSPSEMMGIDQTRINFGVRVYLFTEGTCVDDLFALWEAVEDAISTEKPFRNTTVHDYLCKVLDPAGPAGVMVLRPSAPAFREIDYQTPPKNVSFLSGRGSLVCFLRRPANIVPPPG